MNNGKSHMAQPTQYQQTEQTRQVLEKWTSCQLQHKQRRGALCLKWKKLSDINLLSTSASLGG